MKTYIIINHKDFSISDPVSMNHQGLMFPVANKPLIAHWVDFAIHCGSREIYFLSERPVNEEVRDWFEDGSRWGVQVTFRAAASYIMDLEQMISTIQVDNDSRYMVMKGVFFIQYDKKQDYAARLGSLPSGLLASCSTGHIYVYGPRESSRRGVTSGFSIRMFPLESLEDLFQLSIQAVSDTEGRFFLPGYAEKNGVIVGKDSVIDPSAVIVPPVMIGDHVRVHARATVGPRVVLGNHVVIDSDTELQETVVFDKTYVGSHLTLSGKLVDGATLIDPSNQQVIQLEEQQLLSSMISEGEGGGSQGLVARLLSRFKKIPGRSSKGRKTPLSSKTA